MKLTESQLKRMIKEEIIRKIVKEGLEDMDVPAGQPADDAAALKPVYAIVDRMQEIADERVYERGPEDSRYVHVEVDVEDAVDDEYDRIIEYQGKTMQVCGEIDFTYVFHDYDDAEVSDWEPNIYLQGEDGETLQLNID